jgi:nitroimidazol reductase NimA-like FMN-containing flavoprotein (pyridoxamine 5'-phosphate oxidase superfamily)
MEREMRRKDRLVTDFDEMVSIVSRCMEVHLGMVDEGKAYIVPVDFGYAVRDGRLSLYCHSASEGRKMDILRKNPRVTIELDHSFRIGLGNVPTMWTNAFESVMGEADVVFLETVEERLEAVNQLMERHHMGKLPEKVQGILPHMACYRLDVISMTGKSNLTRLQRDNWGAMEELERKIHDPRVTLQAIRDGLAAFEKE